MRGSWSDLEFSATLTQLDGGWVPFRLGRTVDFLNAKNPVEVPLYRVEEPLLLPTRLACGCVVRPAPCPYPCTVTLRVKCAAPGRRLTLTDMTTCPHASQPVQSKWA
jgi:hypothetical protein